MSLSVLVTGVGGSVGSRVAERLAARGDVAPVVGVDLRDVDVAGAELHRRDLASTDLSDLLGGVDVVVHLATAFSASSFGEEAATADVAVTRRVLAAAGAAGVGRVVLVSSAMVYGAWANNPVPLTEAAPVRPNPDFAYAVSRAEMERTATEWADDGSNRSLVVLRPTTAVSPGESSWVADSLRDVEALAVGDEDPPVQYLHLDDLASAVVAAACDVPAGVYNVAPDGSALVSEVRRLSGPVPRARLTEDGARRIVALRRRAGLARTSPGVLPYTAHPWVVANDRLRATGWEPSFSNAEAYVAAYRARPWAMLNSRRRQQIALGGVAAVTTTGAVAGAWLWRRLRNR